MATVVNKTTFEVIESVNSPDYDPAIWIVMTKNRDNSDYADLIARSVPKKYWKIVANRLVEMSQAEKDVVNADSTGLNKVKKAKYQAIDDKTSLLLAEGFEYPAASGDYYRPDQPVMDMLITLQAVSDAQAAPYLPNTISNANSKKKVTLNTRAEIRDFLLANVADARTINEAGASLKALVRAATTITDVDAVVDNRVSTKPPGALALKG